MPKFILNSGTQQAQEFELKPGKNYIGRAFANDFKIEDASVSGSHALVLVDGNVVTIKDLGSTNGTRINQLPATESPLKSGHVVRLGAVDLLFVADVSTASVPPNATVATISPAAAQIATDFIIRDPSRIGIAPATQTPPAPVATAQSAPPIPTPIRPNVELRIPTAAPPALQPAAPAPIVATAPAPTPLPASTGLRNAVPIAATPPPPAPTMVTPSPRPIAPVVAATIAPMPAMTAPPMAAPPTPVAAPPSVAPVRPEAMDAPAGKIVCKFHTNIPGQWLCQKCNQLFCSLCVASQPTPNGVGYFCRTCGTQCVQVKIKAIAKKEKKLATYTDGTILMRTVGFGVGGALVGAGMWAGCAALTGTDFPPIFAPIIGALCGYSVKVASQDRPGGFFSGTAVAATLLGVALGKLTAYFIMHNFPYSVTSLALALFGLILGVFLAWKIGGGDF